jgi:hypothetical protein
MMTLSEFYKTFKWIETVDQDRFVYALSGYNDTDYWIASIAPSVTGNVIYEISNYHKTYDIVLNEVGECSLRSEAVYRVEMYLMEFFQYCQNTDVEVMSMIENFWR